MHDGNLQGADETLQIPPAKGDFVAGTGKSSNNFKWQYSAWLSAIEAQ